jgi:DNA-binding ferritin-like protein (Dps family)
MPTAFKDKAKTLPSDFYKENYKPLKKELKKTSEEEKISHACGWAELMP